MARDRYSSPTGWAAALVLLAATAACDRGAADPSAAAAPAKTEPAPPVAPSDPTPMAKPAGKPITTPAARTEPVVAPVVAPPPAIPPEPEQESFAMLVERLSKGLPPTDDPYAAGFARYRAKAFDEAMPLFALAAQRDLVAWKHPFNLACAAARSGDQTIARLALIEAVRRGGASVVAKARRDADLEAVRSSAWFEPVLRGETGVPARPAAGPPPPTPTPTSKLVDLPRGTTKPIDRAQLDRLVDALAVVHHAKPVVKASLQHTDADGTARGWAIYELSRFEACVGAASDPKRGKKACKRKLAGNPDEGEPGELECTDQWLVQWMVSIAPTDAIDTDEREELGVGCTMTKVRRLDALDLDGDGKDEVLVDVVGSHSSEGFRESEELEVGRVVRVLRLDHSTQLEFDVQWDAVEISPNDATARRFELRDDDGDGHADLAVSTRDLTATPDVELDDAMWPTAGEPDDTVGPVHTVVWRYDPAKDAWIEPAK
jgi:hypothetical protein